MACLKWPLVSDQHLYLLTAEPHFFIPEYLQYLDLSRIAWVFTMACITKITRPYFPAYTCTVLVWLTVKVSIATDVAGLMA
jgi:hypothetical protein